MEDFIEKIVDSDVMRLHLISKNEEYIVLKLQFDCGNILGEILSIINELNMFISDPVIFNAMFCFEKIVRKEKIEEVENMKVDLKAKNNKLSDLFHKMINIYREMLNEGASDDCTLQFSHLSLNVPDEYYEDENISILKHQIGFAFKCNKDEPFYKYVLEECELVEN